MRILFTALATVLLLVSFSISTLAQTIRRVNNNPGLADPSLYTTLQAAHDAATSGDIIYLEPSDQTYGNLTCSKKLTIIGTGYFLGENPGSQADRRMALVGMSGGGVSFIEGSDGSRMMGCTMSGSLSPLSIIAKNVTVERNYLINVYIGFDARVGRIGPVIDAVVRQNYVTNSIYITSLAGGVTNSGTLIANNIVLGGISGKPSYGTATITNNIAASITADLSVVTNNIITSPTSPFLPRFNTVSNNIGAGTQFGTADGNQQNVSPGSLFVGGAASTDGAYRLRAGANPARGTGVGGVDIGAYGGATPYRLTGIPAVPTITEYKASTAGSTLNVSISTQSND